MSLMTCSFLVDSPGHRGVCHMPRRFWAATGPVSILEALRLWMVGAGRHQRRQGELKYDAMGKVCRCPQPPTVGFYDRTADRESHAHAGGFGGEESVEQPVRSLGGESDAAICDTCKHLLLLVLAGSDH